MSYWIKRAICVAALAIPLAILPGVSASASPGQWWITNCRAQVVGGGQNLIADAKVWNRDNTRHTYSAQVTWLNGEEKLGTTWRPIGGGGKEGRWEAEPGSKIGGVVGMESPSATRFEDGHRLGCRAMVVDEKGSPVPRARRGF